MYYRRELPIASGVYRPLETRRFVMMTMGGYWPVLQKLPNGHLGVVTRDGGFHIGERGRVVFVTSPDGGESWSHSTVIAADGPDNRNPAFGVGADGTLLAAYVVMDCYVDGSFNTRKYRGTGYMPVYISRSEDGGATWSEGRPMVGQGREVWSGAGKVGDARAYNGSSPFGKMITLEDGAILLTYIHAVSLDEEGEWAAAVFVARSHDGGLTWVEPATIAEGFDETSLCDLGGGRMIAVMRRSRSGSPGKPGYQDDESTWQADSDDGGRTWGEPRRVTGTWEHPADVIRLQDGRILLTYGRRQPPCGIQGMVSRDDGNTWDYDNKIFLVGDASATDQGYPSTVQRDDGTIVTVYYSDELHLRGRSGREVLGIHGAAVLYRSGDL
jgi:Neuraminidase (sialidase)